MKTATYSVHETAFLCAQRIQINDCEVGNLHFLVMNQWNHDAYLHVLIMKDPFSLPVGFW